MVEILRAQFSVLVPMHQGDQGCPLVLRMVHLGPYEFDQPWRGMPGACCSRKHFEVEAFLKAFSCAAVGGTKYRTVSWSLLGRSEPWAKAPEVTVGYSKRSCSTGIDPNAPPLDGVLRQLPFVELVTEGQELGMACGVAINQGAKANLMGDALASQTFRDDPNHDAEHGRAAVE